MENHINIIDEYINRLRDILDDISCAGDEKAAKEKQLADKLCRDLCCSKTMEYELRQYIRYCFIENIDINGVVCKMYEENMSRVMIREKEKRDLNNLKADYYNSFFLHIYVEKSVADMPDTVRILNKFPQSHIIYIDHYKDVFCRSRQSSVLQHRTQNLIIAKKEK